MEGAEICVATGRTKIVAAVVGWLLSGQQEREQGARPEDFCDSPLCSQSTGDWVGCEAGSLDLL